MLLIPNLDLSIKKKKKFEGVWGELESKRVSRDNTSQGIWG